MLSIPVALRVRLMQRQRLLTTILVMPITLGTVLVAEGLLNYLGPQGWFNRTLMLLGIDRQPGPAGPQLLGRVPLAGDHGLPVHLPADAVLRHRHRSRRWSRPASTLGASARARFRHIMLPLLVPGLAITFCLSFVQAFSVFPSAVLLGAPAGADARDLDRRLSGGLRGVRLLDGLGDRDDHGRSSSL